MRLPSVIAIDSLLPSLTPLWVMSHICARQLGGRLEMTAAAVDG